ncbi:MAG: sirohydrochlorin chelatase [Pirellulales bacterium]
MPLSQPTTGLLLVGHGTRDPRGQAEFLTLAERVGAALAPQPVEAGYIELSEPTIGDAFRRLVDQGVGQVRVVPLLLFAAGHAKSDVPEAIHQAAALHSHIKVDVTPPFGLDEHLLSLSERRYREAIAGRSAIEGLETYWLLVGRGSSDPTTTEDLARFGAERARRSSLTRFGHCFVAAARPTLADGLSAAASSEAKRIVVQPHLLFRGAVLDEVAAAVNRWGPRRPDIDWVMTAHLGPEQELVEAVIERALLEFKL